MFELCELPPNSSIHHNEAINHSKESLTIQDSYQGPKESLTIQDSYQGPKESLTIQDSNQVPKHIASKFNSSN